MLKVYLDLPILGGILGWIQDGVLLWMVGQISAVKAKWGRLVLGGAVGGLFQLLIMVNQASGGLVNPWIGSPLVFVFLVPALMVGLAFFPIKLKGVFNLLGYFYLLSFLLSGIHWGIDSLNRRYFQLEINFWWRFWAHLALIFILGELGWGVVHRKVWDRICLYPIQINWDGNELNLNALLDTGNRLYDPLTKVPVVIIEFSQVKQLLPNEVVDLIEKMHSGELDKDWEIPHLWQERVRILPFKSIGKEHGILIGFRPDSLKIWQKQQAFSNNHVVVGIYNNQLSPEGAFHALIPPTLLSHD
jgi:stage II sporulation protein GA (sporulation sigma-E factor processing peptidase)